MPKTNRKRRFMAERLERNTRGWRASKHGEAVHVPSGKEGRAFDCRFMGTCCRVKPAFFTSPCGPAESGLNVRKKGGPLTINFVVPKPPARRAIAGDMVAVERFPSKPPARRAIGASCGNVPAFQRITSKKVSGTSFSGSLSNSLIRNPFLRQLFYEAKEGRNRSPGFSLWRSACRKTFPFRRPCRGRGTAHRLSACGTGRGFPHAARFMAGRFAFTFRGRLPILQPILNPFRTRFLMSRVRRLFSGMT